MPEIETLLPRTYSHMESCTRQVNYLTKEDHGKGSDGEMKLDGTQSRWGLSQPDGVRGNVTAQETSELVFKDKLGFDY